MSLSLLKNLKLFGWSAYEDFSLVICFLDSNWKPLMESRMASSSVCNRASVIETKEFLRFASYDWEDLML